MRRAVLTVVVLLAIVGFLAPSVVVAQPQPKVTITGLIDNLVTAASNFSKNDLDLTRREGEVVARTRVRPDITAELGTTKFVLGMEFDYSYGEISSNNNQQSDQGKARGSIRFGETTGATLNTDIARLLEIKWAYTEFDLPWLPFPQRLRLGAQPFDITYKAGVYASSDFAGAHYVAAFTPSMKLLLDWVSITQGATGRGDGFLRGNGYAINAAGDLSPFKGLDIRPLFSWMFLPSATTSAYSGPRLGRGGVPAKGPCTPIAGAANPVLNGGPSTVGPVPGGSPTVFTVPSTPCFAQGAIENRYTVGFDSVWRSGPFSLAPTVYYQWGERALVSSLGKFAGLEHNQKEHAWFVDFRGGWQAGPLLVEGAAIYTTGNKARSDIRDANRPINFYQPLVTDSAYYSGGWGEIWGSGIDYFQKMRANAAGLNPTASIGYDKYGLGRLGTRVAYALTPAFSLRVAANANWAAQGVDTGGAIAGATGITPGTAFLTSGGTCANTNPAGVIVVVPGQALCRTSPGKTKNYLGTELDLGFTYRLAPGLVLDVVGGYMFSGPALRESTATPVCAGDAATAAGVCGFARPETNPKNISVVTARVRYTF
jgi:hypothetical protein